ncbi:MAG: DNA mismatch repair endonuclease MutL [Clostridiales bacterium]|nr:DNA mismatch repair endonuclease MutL [Candidatus Crickella equi]
MIKVLDSFIADKIAAGEVIERPVSIVKELVENSVDAGATSIIVEIRNGGKSYIRVTDNGSGIPAAEVSTAFLRHATSKISTMTDLDGIMSLGFRGEALASISAVSRLTIVTRTIDEAVGSKLVMHGGKEIASEQVGTNVGTTIVVEDVFYNTPARRKFMGSDAREASVIIELIEHYAICYDNIRFMLINNGQTIFTTDGDSNRLNAIRTVFPTKEFRDLIPIESNNVSGYVSNPGVTKSSRRGQLFFVNGRLVQSPVIEKGIERGYGDRIFSGYPIAILFISVDPTTIDVNIHPGKKEIKFLKQDEIIGEIAGAIESVMNTKESIPTAISKLKDIVEMSDQDTTVTLEQKLNSDCPVLDITDYLSSLDREIKQPQKFVQETDEIANYASPLSPEEEEKARATSFIPEEAYDEYEGPIPFKFSELEFKGYIFNAYIIMQARDSIFILDQHAAHERIFYEQLTDNFKSMKQSAQPILTPFTINVSADIYNADRSWMEPLQTMGYDIEDFGPNTFIVKGIPQYMDMTEAENFATTFIENSEDFTNNKTVIDKLIMKSCKSAVKANERLSELEIKELLDKLSKCRNPFSCPHGRPTFVKYTKYEIERSFKRK